MIQNFNFVCSIFHHIYSILRNFHTYIKYTNIVTHPHIQITTQPFVTKVIPLKFYIYAKTFLSVQKENPVRK